LIKNAQLPIGLASEASEPAQLSTPALAGRSFIELIQSQWHRERPDLDLSNFLLSIYLMRLGRVIEQAFDTMCRKRYGISGSDMRVLFALRRGGRPYAQRPTDLFRALLVTSGAVTKKVDRLADLDLVERMPDPDNQGGFLVHLTRKGQQVAEDGVEQVACQSILAPAMTQFTKAEQVAGSQFALRTLATLETFAAETGNEEAAEDRPASTVARKPKRSKSGKGR